MKKTGKVLYWAPRILSILFICFLTLFSLDVFDLGLNAGETALALLMHNIPSLILIIFLVIAWRKEIVGAMVYFFAGLIYNGLVIFNIFNTGLLWYVAISWSLSIAGPAFIIGFLFLISWKRRNKINNSPKPEQSE